jgi:hypothetical protein
VRRAAEETIAREEAQRQREEREARKQAQREREAQKLAEDQRPKVRETQVIMYGVRMWPVDEQERLTTGAYDFDQLFFAIYTHVHWMRLLPATMDHDSRAMHLREKVKPLLLFVSRRIADADAQKELLRFIATCQKLADFYRANPDGECRLPIDPCMSTGWPSSYR